MDVHSLFAPNLAVDVKQRPEHDEAHNEQDNMMECAVPLHCATA